MEQVIGRRIIIGQHRDIVIRHRPIVIGNGDVLNRIGKKTLVDGRCPFDDLFDIESLLVAGRDHNYVLNRVDADIVRAPRGEDVSLGKNLTLSFYE